MNKRNLGLLAALGATLIYGFNHTIAKNVMPTFIEPFAFILLRVLGAAILFWILSAFFKNEKIDKKDWPRIILCSFLGMVINMLAFFKGLELSTPINSSVLITVIPIMVFIFSAIIIKEKISLMKVIGISSGFIGALILILYSPLSGFNAPNIPIGNLLFVLNSSSFALYLIFVKPLVEKYNIITLFRWLFLFGFLMNFPICPLLELIVSFSSPTMEYASPGPAPTVYALLLGTRPKAASITVDNEGVHPMIIRN